MYNDITVELFFWQWSVAKKKETEARLFGLSHGLMRIRLHFSFHPSIEKRKNPILSRHFIWRRVAKVQQA